MTIARLDALFPYFCFGYGFLMTVVLSSVRLNRLADERLPSELVANFRAHRGLAVFCLIIGFVWIMQNIWLT